MDLTFDIAIKGAAACPETCPYKKQNVGRNDPWFSFGIKTHMNSGFSRVPIDTFR